MSKSELEKLMRLSAKVGAAPLLVQGPGGNTSIKHDDIMWIKASGTWLKDAAARQIFVPMDIQSLAAALQRDDPRCESCAEFVNTEMNSGGLRPSIETSVHGLMPQRVVLHVHCVSTIAWAIRQNAETSLQRLLRDFAWSFIPYARPGLLLARAIRQHMAAGSEVLVLGNHGLVVAAETVEDAAALLEAVTEAISLKPRMSEPPDAERLLQIAEGTDYALPRQAQCHAIAMDDWARDHATQYVFYPDHVVFLGDKLTADPANGAAALVVPDAGVLVHKDAKPAVEPMLRCLSDVFSRVPHDAALKPLTPGQIDALVNWDAEIYRQKV
jgi:rhamnose utilization protein RhaD (predicted bifunctional aldolase and dehydrogenase)